MAFHEPTSIISKSSAQVNPQRLDLQRLLGYTVIMLSVKEIKKTLREKRIIPSKRMGQSFLIEKGPAEKILEAAEISENDNIIEIGPGLGALTSEIAKKANKVIAIEKDKRLADLLKEKIDFPNVKILKEDILKVKTEDFGFKEYKVISNLPYYISSPVIRKFLEEKNKPESMALMMQKEVAQKIKSKPPFMSILSISVQIYAQIEIKGIVSKKSFWPEPKVDSAIVKIKPIDIYLKRIKDINLFFKIVKAGFSHPRKQILNNLSKELDSNNKKEIKLNKEESSLWLSKNNIDVSRRPSTLSLEEWINLCNTYTSFF
jgi:16S rRNA (adenine1518-N6/adenine1519-N6)-dimethyltransferase